MKKYNKGTNKKPMWLKGKFKVSQSDFEIYKALALSNGLAEKNKSSRYSLQLPDAEAARNRH